MITLYTILKHFEILKRYFFEYTTLLTKPTGKKILFLIFAMLSVNGFRSINFLYDHFLSKISCVSSLTSFYYVLSYAKIPIEKWMQITVRKAIACIPEELNMYPVFIAIDDTLQQKFGTHFENHQKMFDHAKHNGSNYLDGHCFVALSISIPVFKNDEVLYLSVPIGYSLRALGQNKLKMASKLIATTMEVLQEKEQVILNFTRSVIIILVQGWL